MRERANEGERWIGRVSGIIADNESYSNRLTRVGGGTFIFIWAESVYPLRMLVVCVCAWVCLCLQYRITHRDYSLSAYAFWVCLICVCVCLYMHLHDRLGLRFLLLAAPIRLASRLIAEGIAKLAGPDHSRQSAMSSIQCYPRAPPRSLTLLLSHPPSFFLFPMLDWASSLVIPPSDPIQTRLSSRQTLQEASCFCSLNCHTEICFILYTVYFILALSTALRLIFPRMSGICRI